MISGWPVPNERSSFQDAWPTKPRLSDRQRRSRRKERRKPRRRGDRMKRREFITLLGGAAAAWPLDARGQQSARTYRVGLLASGARILNIDERRTALVRGLAERGYVEGRNLVFDDRFAEGHNERLPGFATELSAARADVIVTFGYPAALAAKQS